MFLDISKNWINLQSVINLNNKTNYLKTYNAMCTVNNNKFTDIKNTIGAFILLEILEMFWFIKLWKFCFHNS